VELESALPDPSGTTGTSLGAVETSSVTETTGPLVGVGKTAELTMLVDLLTDPVDAGITSDSLVEGIDEDDFKILVCSVLGNPVAVKNVQTTQPSSSSAFSNSLQTPSGLLLVNGTRALRLTIGITLGNGTFSSSTSHADTVDDETLLVPISKTSSSIGTCRTGTTMQLCELTVLPATDTQKVPHDVTLLLSVQL